jgi:hypothetical protein
MSIYFELCWAMAQGTDSTASDRAPEELAIAGWYQGSDYEPSWKSY